MAIGEKYIRILKELLFACIYETLTSVHSCLTPSEAALWGIICHFHGWKSEFQYFAELGESTVETNYTKGKVTVDGEGILRQNTESVQGILRQLKTSWRMDKG